MPSANESVSTIIFSQNTVKRKLLQLFQKVTESADVPSQPREENTEDSGMCKGIDVYVCLLLT